MAAAAPDVGWKSVPVTKNRNSTLHRLGWIAKRMRVATWAELVILNPSGRSRTHQLGSEPVTMGRDPGCDIPLDDLSTSRQHARIRLEDGIYHLEDLGSKNGLVVNNVDTRSAVLKSGDEILIGAVRALFREDADKDISASVVHRRQRTHPRCHHILWRRKGISPIQATVGNPLRTNRPTDPPTRSR